MNGNAVRNVVFDWGGVLVDLDVEGCIKAFRECRGSRRANVDNRNERSGTFLPL